MPATVTLKRSFSASTKTKVPDKTNFVTTTVTYSITSNDEINITVTNLLAGTYTLQTLVNVDTVVYKVNTVVKTLPFTVVTNDLLEIDITRTTAGVEASVAIIGPLADIDNAEAAPEGFLPSSLDGTILGWFEDQAPYRFTDAGITQAGESDSVQEQHSVDASEIIHQTTGVNQPQITAGRMVNTTVNSGFNVKTVDASKYNLTGEFYISFYARMGVGTNDFAILMLDGATQLLIVFNSGGNGIEIFTTGGSAIAVGAATAYQDNTFRHFLLARDAANRLKLFIDGSEVADTGKVGLLGLDTGGIVGIMRGTTDSGLTNGSMDNVIISKGHFPSSAERTNLKDYRDPDA